MVPKVMLRQGKGLENACGVQLVAFSSPLAKRVERQRVSRSARYSASQHTSPGRRSMESVDVQLRPGRKHQTPVMTVEGDRLRAWIDLCILSWTQGALGSVELPCHNKQMDPALLFWLGRFSTSRTCVFVKRGRREASLSLLYRGLFPHILFATNPIFTAQLHVFLPNGTAEHSHNVSVARLYGTRQSAYAACLP